MKRKLAKALAFAAVMSLASTAFAANASFSDVPAKHWAYGAVNQLVKAGVVEGYANNTFNGDKTISRYEMAIIVAKTMDRYEKADENTKLVIDKLSAEFAKELNTLGARVAKVEKKTNTFLVGGETRFRFSGNSPNASAIALRGGDRFDFRQRISLRSTINDNMEFNARMATAGGSKFGNMENLASGSEFSLDLLNVTMKNTLGFDSIRIGRSFLDFFSRGLIGKPFNTDGVLVKKKIGDVKWEAWTGNIQPTGDGKNYTMQGESNQFTTTQFGYKVNNNLNVGAGYYWSNTPGTSGQKFTSGGNAVDTSIYANINGRPGNGYGPGTTAPLSYTASKGADVNFAYKMGEITLMGDFITSKLENAVGLANNPKAFAFEITNSKEWPYMYPVVNLVNPSKTGTSAWMVSYRSMDAGSVPAGTGGFDYSANSYASTYNSSSKSSDNVKGYWFVYQNVVAKNTILSLEYQDLKIKNLGLTSLASDKLDKAYQASIQFFY